MIRFILIIFTMYCYQSFAQITANQVEKQNKEVMKKLRKTHKLQKVNTVSLGGIYYFKLTAQNSAIGLADIYGNIILHPLYSNIRYISPITSPKANYGDQNKNIDIPTTIGLPARFIAITQDKKQGCLISLDGQILKTFNNQPLAKFSAIGDYIVYNYTNWFVFSEDNTAEGSSLNISTRLKQGPYIGVIDRDGNDIFLSEYKRLQYDIKYNFISYTKIINGREITGARDLDDPNDYVPSIYHDVYRGYLYGNDLTRKLQWLIYPKRTSKLEAYNAENPQSIVFESVIDSLYEYQDRRGLINFFDSQTAHTALDYKLMVACVSEIAESAAIESERRLNIYKETKKWQENLADPNFDGAYKYLFRGLDLLKEQLKTNPDSAAKATIGKQSQDIKRISNRLKNNILEYNTAKSTYYTNKAETEERLRQSEERLAKAISNFGSTLFNKLGGSSSNSSRNSVGTTKTSSSTSSKGSSSKSSSSSSSNGELVTVEKHITCGGCKGSGKMTKFRGTKEYETTCTVCKGTGYVVRYENVRK